MSKQAITWLVVAVVVIGGIVLYSSHNKKDASYTSEQNTQSSVSDTSTNTSTATPEAFTGSIKDLVARNQPVQCTFTESTSGADTKGTMYIASGKVRGNFEVTYSGQMYHAYMISDGSMVYIWSSMLPQGFKSPVPKPAAVPSTAPTNGVDYNQSLDYSCTPWTPDTSLFAVPTNITFAASSAAQPH